MEERQLVRVQDDSIVIAETVRTETVEGTALNIKGFITGEQIESSSLSDNVIRQATQQVTNLLGDHDLSD